MSKVYKNMSNRNVKRQHRNTNRRTGLPIMEVKENRYVSLQRSPIIFFEGNDHQ